MDQEDINDLVAKGNAAMGRCKTADKDVRVQQVIITKNATRGDGRDTPIRPILQVWSMDGELIAENDPCRD